MTTSTTAVVTTTAQGITRVSTPDGMQLGTVREADGGYDALSCGGSVFWGTYATLRDAVAAVCEPRGWDAPCVSALVISGATSGVGSSWVLRHGTWSAR